ARLTTGQNLSLAREVTGVPTSTHATLIPGLNRQSSPPFLMARRMISSALQSRLAVTLSSHARSTPRPTVLRMRAQPTSTDSPACRPLSAAPGPSPPPHVSLRPFAREATFSSYFFTMEVPHL